MVRIEQIAEVILNVWYQLRLSIENNRFQTDKMVWWHTNPAT
ncbi:MAG: hypothetical protein ACTSUW_01775 [Candidatus Heimdallarchaeota archaeon]